jgi:VWFA-related protein
MRALLAAAGVMAVTAAFVDAVPASRAERPRQVFRAATDSVAVDVAVRQGSRPVKGLRSEDFELLDNGVRQAIDAVSVEEVPVDLTLVLDASSSTAAVIGRFKSRAEQIAAMLRSGDRVRLVSFATEIVEVFPLTPAGARLPLDRLTARGVTSLHEALLLSLARAPGVGGHRQLVVAFTDGQDNGSVIDAATVAAVASRADCVFHLVLSGYPGLLPATARSLRAAAEATGGALHDPGEFDDAVDAFRRLFEDFRQSYVLRYTLQGVERQGWHDISLRVVAPGGQRYTVRARRGYIGG